MFSFVAITLKLALLMMGSNFKPLPNIEPGSMIPALSAEAQVFSSLVPDWITSTPPYKPPVMAGPITPKEEPITDGAPVLALLQYVLENLSPDLYSNVDLVNNDTMGIYCIRSHEASLSSAVGGDLFPDVKAVIDSYTGPKVDVFYNVAHYPQSLLLPILEEVADDPFIISNMHQLNSIEITGRGIEIFIKDADAFPEIVEWVRNYAHNSYLWIMENEHMPAVWYVGSDVPSLVRIH